MKKLVIYLLFCFSFLSCTRVANQVTPNVLPSFTAYFQKPTVSLNTSSFDTVVVGQNDSLNVVILYDSKQPAFFTINLAYGSIYVGGSNTPLTSLNGRVGNNYFFYGNPFGVNPPNASYASVRDTVGSRTLYFTVTDTVQKTSILLQVMLTVTNSFVLKDTLTQPTIQLNNADSLQIQLSPTRLAPNLFSNQYSLTCYTDTLTIQGKVYFPGAPITIPTNVNVSYFTFIPRMASSNKRNVVYTIKNTSSVAALGDSIMRQKPLSANASFSFIQKPIITKPIIVLNTVDSLQFLIGATQNINSLALVCYSNSLVYKGTTYKPGNGININIGDLNTLTFLTNQLGNNQQLIFTIINTSPGAVANDSLSYSLPYNVLANSFTLISGLFNLYPIANQLDTIYLTATVRTTVNPKLFFYSNTDSLSVGTNTDFLPLDTLLPLSFLQTNTLRFKVRNRANNSVQVVVKNINAPSDSLISIFYYYPQ